MKQRLLTWMMDVPDMNQVNSSSSSAYRRLHYVSWSVDPLPSHTLSLSEEFSSHVVIGSAGQMLRSVLGSPGGPGNRTLSQSSPPITPGRVAQPAGLSSETEDEDDFDDDDGGVRNRTCIGGANADEDGTCRVDDDDDGDEGHGGGPGAPPSGSSPKGREPSLLAVEGDQYYLPRSSPVISRKRCSSWAAEQEQQAPSGSPPCLSVTSPHPNLRQLSPPHPNTPQPSDPARKKPSFLYSVGAPHPSDTPQPSTSVRNSGSTSPSTANSGPPPAELPAVGAPPPPDAPQPCPGLSGALAGSPGAVPAPSGSPEPHLPCFRTAEPRGVALSVGWSRLLPTALHPGPRRRPCCNTHLLSVPCKDRRSCESSHIPENIFRNSMDLDQENAHFVVADIVLELLEELRWAVCLTQGTSASAFSTDRSSSKRSSLSSLHSSLQYPMMPCSAEALAQQLLSEFRKCWLPLEEPHGNRDDLNTVLQEFQPDAAVAMAREEIRQRSRMRGTLTWAPPRFQIIFNIHPAHRRSEVVASQHFLCAGCGTEIEPRYMKRLRYCEYLGRYFCDSCHGGGECVLPGRVLVRWDFGYYPVCRFSCQLLESIWHQPLFNLTTVAKGLYSRARELDRFRGLQEQLLGIKKLLTACRLSDRVLAEFEQLPGHLMCEPHLFSMDDLVKVKRGQLVAVARTVLRSATAHVETCELCLARGFICEFCRTDDVIFPFQRHTCTCCPDCRACFHSACFRGEECPKCARIHTRQQRLETSGVLST